MMVEIEQLDIDDLTSGMKTKSLSKIDPDANNFCFVPDNPVERCVFLHEKFSNFGSNIEFFDKGFIFSLISDLPSKYAKYDLVQNQAWMVFSKHNVEILDRECKLYECHGSTYVLQKFKCRLLNTVDNGYLQFYSVPQFVRCDGAVYKKHELMHISVYDSQKVRSLIPSPSLITIRPNKDNVYVSLLPKQKLQIIVPEKQHVEINDSKYLKTSTIDKKSLSRGGNLVSSVLTCNGFVENQITILAKSKKNHSKRKVIIPALIRSHEGGVYALIEDLVSDCNIFCHNLSGLMILNIKKKSEWLYDNDEFDMTKSDDSAVIKFTTNHRCVNLSNTDGHWWLMGNPKYDLSKLS